MREALLILRKDVRCFRIPLAAYLGLMVIFAWMQASLPRRPEFHAYILGCEVLLLLAGCYLAVMIFHQEALPGDRQYWLTRPFPWRSLLLAKIGFFLLFVNLPVLVSNVVTLVANGLSPFASLGPLLAKQWFLTAFLVLPVAALAAVTTNFAQFTMGVLSGFGALLVIGLGRGGTALQDDLDWGAFAWIMKSGFAALALLVLMGVLFLQYSHRATLISQAILGGSMLGCALTPALNLWHGAFVLQGVLQSRPSPPTGNSAIHISLDPARDLALGRGALSVSPGTQSFVRILIPVQVTGVPAGMQLLGERIQASVETPGGAPLSSSHWNSARWISGWSSLGGILQQTGDPRLLPADGPYFQYMYIDRAFFEQIKDTPAHLHTTVALTLLSTARSTRLPPPTTSRLVPEIGFCSTSANYGEMSRAIRGSLSVVCFSPFQHADRVEVLMQSRRTGRIEPTGMSEEVSYSPYPTDLGPSAWKTLRAGILVRDPGDLDIVLEARRAASHFERDLDIPNIRLAQYQDSPLAKK